jgi:uncharacterized membrane protein
MLSESKWLIAIGLALIIFGGILVLLAKVWHDEYEVGGHDPNHARPVRDEDAKPWMLDSGGHPIVERPRHHHRLEGDADEGTRRLWPTTSTARSRVVMIGPEGIEDDEAASRTHRTGETGRVRRAPAEGHVEEEGGADRERGQLPREAVADGEEGGADPEGARAAVRVFRNDATGEIIMLDAEGRKIEWSS